MAVATPKTAAPTEPFRILLYAKCGSGKTRLAATAAAVPELSPVLFLSIDKSTAVIDRKKFPVHIVNVNTIAELSAALLTVGEYKTVVVDTLSEIHAMMLNESMRANALVAKAKGRDKSDFVPEQLDFAGAQNATLLLLRRLRDRNLNLICTAQDTELVDGTGANQVTLFDHAPRTAKGCTLQAPEFFQLVGYCERKGETFTIDFYKQRSIVKDTRRVFKPNAPLANPTIATIFAAFNNGNNA